MSSEQQERMIVEQGSHTELLNMKNGLYKKLYQTDY